MKIKIDSLLGSKRERTRDQLLVSAQSLLMSEGAAALGLRQITTHAGMVHASFYNYYPDCTGRSARGRAKHLRMNQTSVCSTIYRWG